MMSRAVFLALALTSTTAACSSVHHATRAGKSGDPRDATLVKVVTEGYDGPVRYVSFSAWDVELGEDLPEKAPPEVLDDMRGEAADNGAELLIVERYEDDYRQAFYGWGAIPDELAPKNVPVCGHPGFDISLDRAKESARACVTALRARRPQLQGTVEVVFQIDGDGQVLRAAPTAASSRDSELQGCVLEALHQSGFGIPLELTCQARIGVDLSQ